MGSTFNDIPVDLLLKIFMLQPLSSLVLLSFVCKLWDQIISSDHFNDLRLARERTSSNTNKYLLLEGLRGSKSTSLVDSDKYVYHDIPMKNYECYGICDGLLCLASIKDYLKAYSRIILWNPIFRKLLPPLEIRYSQITYLCFGYHDDDYKVIKVVVLRHMYYVCIYSLSTHCWKVLKFNGLISGIDDYRDFKLRDWCRQKSKGRLVNGVAYFAGKNRILCFDLGSETFREPEDFWDSGGIIMEEYRKSLVVIGCSKIDSWAEYINHYIEMRILREDDNSFSYIHHQIQMLTVSGKSNDDHLPVGFINTDELVIRITTHNPIQKYSFYLYNVDNSCVRPFTSQDTCATMVQYFSSNVESFIGAVGVEDEVSWYMKPIHSPAPQPQRPKKKNLASSFNSYAALADYGDDLLDEDA